MDCDTRCHWPTSDLLASVIRRPVCSKAQFLTQGGQDFHRIFFTKTAN